MKNDDYDDDDDDDNNNKYYNYLDRAYSNKFNGRLPKFRNDFQMDFIDN